MAQYAQGIREQETMKKLVGRIIGFVVFAGVFLCAAGGILAVAT